MCLKNSNTVLLPETTLVQIKLTAALKGQYHAIFSSTLKIEKTLFG